MTNNTEHYGIGDSTFQAAGGEAGIQQLVDDFYLAMETEPFARKIFQMHLDDKTMMRDKLARFLCGWTGGPKRFQEKYGPISIPGVHMHLNVGEEERDAWLGCMKIALSKQDYTAEFQAYLLHQLSFPAQRIHEVTQHNR